MAMAIEDHAVIGDLRTAALVALDGSIDFMCWPRFDSPSVFAHLLEEKAGSFTLKPVLNDGSYRQAYMPDTNIILTRVLSSSGVSEISDFMVPAPISQTQRLIRRVKAIRGGIRFDMRCAPRFNYARTGHKVHQLSSHVVIFEPDDPLFPRLRLCSTVKLIVKGNDVVAEFCLEFDKVAFFSLDGETHKENFCEDDEMLVSLFKETDSYWRDWVARSNYHGRWHDQIIRSTLALKLLTSHELGSMVAAATFGLPEDVGGERNWDYRYCWIRDSSFMVYAFMQTGHKEEATAFIRWVHARRVEAHPGQARLKVLYAIDGQPMSSETELEHFRGYRNSRPVRIGNAAEGQLQLDIIGEIMDAIFHADENCERLSWEAWRALREGIDWLCFNWNQEDESIWEVRGGRRHFLTSRVMCWVAFDRAIRLAQKRGLPCAINVWVRERSAIYNDIQTGFWDEELGYYVQYKGGQTIDASCLMMPLMGFISDHDPRWLSTLEAVGAQLLDDSHVYRYRTQKDYDGKDDHAGDGLSGSEGTFTMCSFWYIECVARTGDLLKARLLFEKILSYANHVGLFSEEIGPSGEHLGNFPQAFTHIALIRCGQYLDKAFSKSGDRNSE
ncbi:MAG: glycoside hydrolase family 15 protein [Acetobacteraceae bacterium]